MHKFLVTHPIFFRIGVILTLGHLLTYQTAWEKAIAFIDDIEPPIRITDHLRKTFAKMTEAEDTVQKWYNEGHNTRSDFALVEHEMIKARMDMGQDLIFACREAIRS